MHIDPGKWCLNITYCIVYSDHTEIKVGMRINKEQFDCLNTHSNVLEIERVNK